MRKCIIHVGMHKTGSSSIQRSLNGFSNEEIVYAQFSNLPNHSIPLGSLFAPYPEKHWSRQLARRTGNKPPSSIDLQSFIDKMRIELDNNLTNVGDRTLLFSGEGISRLPKKGLKKLYKFFKSKFEHITIVAYIRPPAGYISSAFLQRLKGGDLDRLEPIYRSYRIDFCKLDEVFGPENVLLWKFSPKSFPGNCVVQDFCRRLGIAFPVSRIIRRNESFPKEIASLLYIYSKFSEELGLEKLTASMSRHLIAELSDVCYMKFRFAPSLIKPLLDKNREDIAWMEARLGQPLLENLSQDEPGDIREESDLLTPDPTVVRELRTRFGAEALGIDNMNSLQVVAALVHAFFKKKF